MAKLFSALLLEYCNKKTRKLKKNHVPNTLQTAVKELISSFAGLDGFC